MRYSSHHGNWNKPESEGNDDLIDLWHYSEFHDIKHKPPIILY